MYHKHHTKGIVLSHRNDGKDSRNIRILTEKFGVIMARVQAARNTSSKMRGAVQDFTLGNFSVIQGKQSWKVVSAASEKNIYENLKNSPEKVRIAANIFSLVQKLVDEESSLAISDLYFKIAAFLNFLESADQSILSIAECLILLRILHTLGFLREDPDLSIPISSTEINTESLSEIAPKRARMIQLINESLRENI